MEEIIFGKNSYWRKKEDNTYDGPYCMTCYDKDKKLIRLSQVDKEGTVYKCSDHGIVHYVEKPK